MMGGLTFKPLPEPRGRAAVTLGDDWVSEGVRVERHGDWSDIRGSVAVEGRGL